MMNRILLMMIIVQKLVFAQFTIPDINVEYVIDGDTFIAPCISSLSLVVGIMV